MGLFSFHEQKRINLLLMFSLYCCGAVLYHLIQKNRNRLKNERFHLDKIRNFSTLRTASRGTGCCVGFILGVFQDLTGQSLEKFGLIHLRAGNGTRDLLRLSQPEPWSQRGSSIASHFCWPWNYGRGCGRETLSAGCRQDGAGGPQACSCAAPAGEEGPCCSSRHAAGAAEQSLQSR